MLRIAERLYILGELESVNMCKELTEFYSIAQLRKALKEIERLDLQNTFMDRYCPLELQKKIVEDTSLLGYLKGFLVKKIPLKLLEQLLEFLKEYRARIADYTVEEVIRYVAKADNIMEVVCGYLTCFKTLAENGENEEDIWEKVLILYKKEFSDAKEIAEDPKLRNLYIKTDMENNIYVAQGQTKSFLELLRDKPILQQVLAYMKNEEIYYCFRLENLEVMSGITADDFEKLKKIWKWLQHKNIEIRCFMNQWIESKAPHYELNYFSQKNSTFWEKVLPEVFYTRVGYLNEIYSRKLMLPFEELNEYQKDVLIYAIRNERNHFLQLISEYSQLFMELGANALLFDPDFYHRCNLNTLTKKNLMQCRGEAKKRSTLQYLEKREYTFAELKTLRYVGKVYIRLYNMLEIRRVDDRLLVIRELLKRNLISNDDTEEVLQNLARNLSKQRLSIWREKELSHIIGLDYRGSVRILAVYDQIKHLIPELKTWEEALYAARNAKQLQDAESWKIVRENLLDNDQDLQKLIKQLNFSEEFLKENERNILHFVLQEGAEMSRIYFDSTPCKEAFRRIIQAEFMGEFKQLKYFQEDLKKEINYPLGKYQEIQWRTNETLREQNVIVTEADDFYTTLRIGTLPYATCLSYNGGMYNDCLLACFDSNKKVLLAKRDGEVVGRASIRLTKGAFFDVKNQRQSLEFADLLAEEPVKTDKEKKERLTLFLERPYISGAKAGEAEQIKRLFIRLITKKAESLNALPVLALDYRESSKAEYMEARYYMYVSKSKGGAQYLDSMSGDTSVSEEESYKKGIFMILKKKLSERTVV